MEKKQIVLGGLALLLGSSIVVGNQIYKTGKENIAVYASRNREMEVIYNFEKTTETPESKENYVEQKQEYQK